MTTPDAAPRLKTMGAEAAQVLAQLHEIAFRSGEVWDAAAFATMLAIPGTEAVIAMLDATPVGFILLRTVCGETEILTLAVHPDFRRRGVGTRLVQDACLRGKYFLKFR